MVHLTSSGTSSRTWSATSVLTPPRSVTPLPLTALEVLLFPTNLHLSLCKALVQENVLIGAQNVSRFPPGAYTGEVSADHLKDSGIEWTIIGHSERRSIFGETNEEIN